MDRLSSRESGFSLIELLVSVAIVGILSSISVASFSEYKRKTHIVAAENNVRMLRTAFEAKDTTLDSTGLVYLTHRRFGGTMAGPLHRTTLTPGFPWSTITDDSYTYIRYDTACDAGSCLRVHILSGTCDGGYVSGYFARGDGTSSASGGYSQWWDDQC